MLALAGHPLEVLSVQEVTSCDRHERWHCPNDDDCRNPDAGCNGGDPVFGALYACNVSHGLALESEYPTTSSRSGKTGKCREPRSKVPLRCKGTGYSWAASPCDKGKCHGRDENMLKANLAAYGPAAISVDAGGRGWQSYKRGIMPERDCKSAAVNKLDHAVQLVGYGEGYWTVRNSWAEDWGEKGYIRFPFGTNACGLADQPFFVDF